jgi:nucleoside-diphosphate-sugar epimerase
MTPPTIRTGLILGCGYLGVRVARAWQMLDRRVWALTRSRAAELQSQGIEPLTGDWLGKLPDLPATDVVLIAVGWDRRSGASMRQVYVDGLAHALAKLPASSRLIYVSSTSVYGQTDGQEVDETAATDPSEESGRIVLEAEQLLRSHRPDATILRFAGIYGPNRILRREAVLRGEPFPGDPQKWLNLIHVEDGVRAVLVAEGVQHETINIADGSPVARGEFYSFLASLLNAPPVRFDAQIPSTRETHRRIGIQKARRFLGFDPAFPSYREGLPAALAETGQ